MSSTPLLVASDLFKSFTKGKEVISVLTGLQMCVDAGQMVSITGRSGSGKSTLLHILGSLEHPDKGQVLWNGKSVFMMKDGARTRLRGQTVGFIFQSHHLLPELTAIENVAMPLLIAHKGLREGKMRAAQCLERVGLSDRLEHKPGELSGGEQQRVAVARALALSPPLILADEPSGNLDKPTGEQLHHLIQGICREENTAFIIVTHNEELAMMSDRHLKLTEGILIE
jgi:lipoprotein-releasing system ATP-binding protein